MRREIQTWMQSNNTSALAHLTKSISTITIVLGVI